MPAHPDCFEHLRRDLIAAAAARNWARCDALLDKWLRFRDLATEWDAEQWNLRDVDQECRRLSKK